MSKVDVKVIVGSNYGDEGKGMATHFFSNNAQKQLCLNVLYNGGCQRGHTVELRNGKRHVFIILALVHIQKPIPSLTKTLWLIQHFLLMNSINYRLKIV